MQTASERILEINSTPLIVASGKHPVTYIDGRFVHQPGQGLFAKLKATLRHARGLLEAARDRRHGIVVCRSFGRFIYRRNISVPVNALRWLMGWFIRYCVWLRVARGGARLFVVDWQDENIIGPRDLFLLDHCEIYYKCQLPQNHWGVFRLVEPQHEQPVLLMQNPKFLPRVKKLRPLTLGIGAAKVARIEQALRAAPSLEKTTDVFFAGSTFNSTVRSGGIAQVRALAQRGWRVEVHEGVTLPFEEFIQRMARAWLVWSPEGQGWECYRHMEACLVNATPLMNHSQNHRHQPLLDGVHGIYYAIEGDDLTRKVEQALADKAKLSRMAQAAKAHILAHYTHANLGDYVVDQMRAADPSSPPRD